MKIEYGHGPDETRPGIDIHLTGAEVALAINAYIMARGVFVSGQRTIRVNDELIKKARVYVDPSGFVINEEGDRMDSDAYNELQRKGAEHAVNTRRLHD